MKTDSLKQYCETINDTCIIVAEKEEHTGILYYKNGKILNAGLDGSHSKENVEKIMNWDDAEVTKIKIDPVTKFPSKFLKYIFDIIEYAGISTDIYIKRNKEIVVLSFSVGSLVSVIPEIEITKELIIELTEIEGKNFKMKLTHEKTGHIKIYISELLGE